MKTENFVQIISAAFLECLIDPAKEAFSGCPQLNSIVQWDLLFPKCHFSLMFDR